MDWILRYIKTTFTFLYLTGDWATDSGTVTVSHSVSVTVTHSVIKVKAMPHVTISSTISRLTHTHRHSVCMYM